MFLVDYTTTDNIILFDTTGKQFLTRDEQNAFFKPLRLAGVKIVAPSDILERHDTQLQSRLHSVAIRSACAPRVFNDAGVNDANSRNLMIERAKSELPRGVRRGHATRSKRNHYGAEPLSVPCGDPGAMAPSQRLQFDTAHTAMA